MALLLLAREIERSGVSDLNAISRWWITNRGSISGLSLARNDGEIRISVDDANRGPDHVVRYFDPARAFATSPNALPLSLNLHREIIAGTRESTTHDRPLTPTRGSISGTGAAAEFARLLYSEVVQPREKKSGTLAVDFCSGADIATILLATNADRVIMVDNHPLNQDAFWNPKYASSRSHSEQALKDRYLQEKIFGSYIPTELLDEVHSCGNIYFALKWELEFIGVDTSDLNDHIEKIGDGIREITLDWAYPYEAAKKRTIYYVERAISEYNAESAIKVLNELETLGHDAHGIDVVMEKASDAYLHAVVPLGIAEYLDKGTLYISDRPSLWGEPVIGDPRSDHFVSVEISKFLKWRSQSFGYVAKRDAPGQIALNHIVVYERQPGRESLSGGGQGPVAMAEEAELLRKRAGESRNITEKMRLYKASITLCRDVLDTHPIPGVRKGVLNCMGYSKYELGKVYFRTGKPDEAEASVRSALLDFFSIVNDYERRYRAATLRERPTVDKTRVALACAGAGFAMCLLSDIYLFRSDMAEAEARGPLIKQAFDSLKTGFVYGSKGLRIDNRNDHVQRAVIEIVKRLRRMMSALGPPATLEEAKSRRSLFMKVVALRRQGAMTADIKRATRRLLPFIRENRDMYGAFTSLNDYFARVLRVYKPHTLEEFEFYLMELLGEYFPRLGERPQCLERLIPILEEWLERIRQLIRNEETSGRAYTEMAVLAVLAAMSKPTVHINRRDEMEEGDVPERWDVNELRKEAVKIMGPFSEDITVMAQNRPFAWLGVDPEVWDSREVQGDRSQRSGQRLSPRIAARNASEELDRLRELRAILYRLRPWLASDDDRRLLTSGFGKAWVKAREFEQLVQSYPALDRKARGAERAAQLARQEKAEQDMFQTNRECKELRTRIDRKIDHRLGSGPMSPAARRADLETRIKRLNEAANQIARDITIDDTTELTEEARMLLERSEALGDRRGEYYLSFKEFERLSAEADILEAVIDGMRLKLSRLTNLQSRAGRLVEWADSLPQVEEVRAIGDAAKRISDTDPRAVVRNEEEVDIDDLERLFLELEGNRERLEPVLARVSSIAATLVDLEGRYGQYRDAFQEGGHGREAYEYAGESLRYIASFIEERVYGADILEDLESALTELEGAETETGLMDEAGGLLSDLIALRNGEFWQAILPAMAYWMMTIFLERMRLARLAVGGEVTIPEESWRYLADAEDQVLAILTMDLGSAGGNEWTRRLGRLDEDFAALQGRYAAVHVSHAASQDNRQDVVARITNDMATEDGIYRVDTRRRDLFSYLDRNGRDGIFREVPVPLEETIVFTCRSSRVFIRAARELLSEPVYSEELFLAHCETQSVADALPGQSRSTLDGTVSREMARRLGNMGLRRILKAVPSTYIMLLEHLYASMPSTDALHLMGWGSIDRSAIKGHIRERMGDTEAARELCEVIDEVPIDFLMAPPIFRNLAPWTGADLWFEWSADTQNITRRIDKAHVVFKSDTEPYNYVDIVNTVVRVAYLRGLMEESSVPSDITRYLMNTWCGKMRNLLVICRDMGQYRFSAEEIVELSYQVAINSAIFLMDEERAKVREMVAGSPLEEDFMFFENALLPFLREEESRGNFGRLMQACGRYDRSKGPDGGLSASDKRQLNEYLRALVERISGIDGMPMGDDRGSIAGINGEIEKLLRYGVYTREEIDELEGVVSRWKAGGHLGDIDMWRAWSFVVLTGRNDDDAFSALREEVRRLGYTNGETWHWRSNGFTTEIGGVRTGYPWSAMPLFQSKKALETKEALIRKIVFSPGEVVLDVGCGSGEDVIRIAAENPEINVIGIDAYPSNIRRAIENAEVSLARPSNIRFILRDFRAAGRSHPLSGIPLADSSVDKALILMDVFYGQPDEFASSACREIVRVMKPGDEIVFFGLSGLDDLVGTRTNGKSVQLDGMASSEFFAMNADANWAKLYAFILTVVGRESISGDASISPSEIVDYLISWEPRLGRPEKELIWGRDFDAEAYKEYVEYLKSEGQDERYFSMKLFLWLILSQCRAIEKKALLKPLSELLLGEYGDESVGLYVKEFRINDPSGIFGSMLLNNAKRFAREIKRAGGDETHAKALVDILKNFSQRPPTKRKGPRESISGTATSPYLYANPRSPDPSLLDDDDREHFRWDKKTRYWRHKVFDRLVLGGPRDIIRSSRKKTEAGMRNWVAIRCKGYSMYAIDNHGFKLACLVDAIERREVPEEDLAWLVMDRHYDLYPLKSVYDYAANRIDSLIMLVQKSHVSCSSHHYPMLELGMLAGWVLIAGIADYSSVAGEKIVRGFCDLIEKGAYDTSTVPLRLSDEKFIGIGILPQNPSGIGWDIETDVIEPGRAMDIVQYAAEVLLPQRLLPNILILSTTSLNEFGGFGRVEDVRTLAEELPPLIEEAKGRESISGISPFTGIAIYGDTRKTVELISHLTQKERDDLERLILSSRSRSILFDEEIKTIGDLRRSMEEGLYLQRHGFLGNLVFAKDFSALLKYRGDEGVAICEFDAEKPYTKDTIDALDMASRKALLSLMTLEETRSVGTTFRARYVYVAPDVSREDLQKFLNPVTKEASGVGLIPKNNETLHFERASLSGSADAYGTVAMEMAEEIIKGLASKPELAERVQKKSDQLVGHLATALEKSGRANAGYVVDDIPVCLQPIEGYTDAGWAIASNKTVIFAPPYVHFIETSQEGERTETYELSPVALTGVNLPLDASLMTPTGEKRLSESMVEKGYVGQVLEKGHLVAEYNFAIIISPDGEIILHDEPGLEKGGSFEYGREVFFRRDTGEVHRKTVVRDVSFYIDTIKNEGLLLAEGHPHGFVESPRFFFNAADLGQYLAISLFQGHPTFHITIERRGDVDEVHMVSPVPDKFNAVVSSYHWGDLVKDDVENNGIEGLNYWSKLLGGWFGRDPSMNMLDHPDFGFSDRVISVPAYGVSDERESISGEPRHIRLTKEIHRNRMDVRSLLSNDRFGANPVEILENPDFWNLFERKIPLMSVMGSVTYASNENGTPDWDAINDIDFRFHSIFSERAKVEIAIKLFREMAASGGFVEMGAPAVLSNIHPDLLETELLKTQLWRIEDRDGRSYPLHLNFDGTRPMQLFTGGHGFACYKPIDLYFGDTTFLDMFYTPQLAIDNTVRFYTSLLSKVQEDAALEYREGDHDVRLAILKKLYQLALLRGKGKELRWLLDTFKKLRQAYDNGEWLRAYESAIAVVQSDEETLRTEVTAWMKEQAVSQIVEVEIELSDFVHGVGGRGSEVVPDRESISGMELVEGAHNAGLAVLEGVIKLDQDLTQRVIPINVATLPCETKENSDALRKVLEIIALKQWYLNKRYGPGRIRFEFVRIGEGGKLERAENHRLWELYNDELDIVKKKGLEMPVRLDGCERSFLITDEESLPEDYDETRVVVMKEAMGLDRDGSELTYWSSILDLAIAETILLGQGDSARASAYSGLRALYKRLNVDVDEAQLSALLKEKISDAVDVARHLAIPPAEMFNLEELNALYERMRALAEAA